MGKFKLGIIKKLVLLLTPFNLLAEGEDSKKSYRDIYYLNFQFAGNVGLGSVNFGYSSNENLFIGILYGYLPSFVHGAEVHTAGIRLTENLFSVKSFNKSTFEGYVGGTAFVAFSKNTYVVFPDYFPKGYYLTNAVHLAPFAGLKFKPRNNTFHPYFELGTLDYYFYNFVISREVKFFDIWNLAFGIAIPLNK